MTPNIPFWTVTGAAGWSILSKLVSSQATFKRRIVDEVADLLRKPDHDLLRDLLDVAEDRSLRHPALGHPDRREQRVRLDKLREQYYRLIHNSTIVYQWGDTEWRDMIYHGLKESYGPELIRKIKELRLAAIEFRATMRITMAKISFLSIIHFDAIPFMHVPSVAALGRTGHIDILKAYQRVKNAALVLAAVHGDGQEYVVEIQSGM